MFIFSTTLEEKHGIPLISIIPRMRMGSIEEERRKIFVRSLGMEEGRECLTNS